MVTRRRSPTSDSIDNEIALRASLSSPHLSSHGVQQSTTTSSSRVPLHVYNRSTGYNYSSTRSPNVSNADGDDYADDEEGGWMDSPTRYASHSSTGSDGSESDFASNSPSPPYITQTIRIPSSHTLNSRENQHTVETGTLPPLPHYPNHHNTATSSSMRSSTAPMHNDSKNSRRSLASSYPQKDSNPPLFLVGLLLIGLVAAYVSRSSVGFAVQRASELVESRHHLSNKLFQTESDLQSLKREMLAMNALIEQQQQVENHGSKESAAKNMAINELNALQGRIKNLSSQGDSLKDRVQALSRQELQHKYGDGPKFVEVNLIFLDGSKGPSTFIIEVATDKMPHSSFVFLEMVQLGLLDGCSFILNALHVLKAAPLPYDGSSANAKAKQFAQHGLESVAFKEYNPEYPHAQYTVGFAADATPSFYINTEDNTDIHVGDPCFGRIVSGVDAIQRLEAQPTRNGIWFAQKIGIQQARILQSLPRHHQPPDGRLRTGSAD